MMSFGIDANILEKALKKGIRVKRGDRFVDAPGHVSLTYIPQYGDFVLAYGSSSSDAGYVRTNAYGREWEVRDAD